MVGPEFARSRARDRAGVLACPLCKNKMKQSGHGSVLFDQCDDHGMWVVARLVDEFRAAFGPEIARVEEIRDHRRKREIESKEREIAAANERREDDRKVEELTAQLLGVEPSDARAVAVRIVRLERMVIELLRRGA
jgi:hypothetical protein